MSEGVIYLTWGERATKEAHQSIESLRCWAPDLLVLTLGDHRADRPLDYLCPFDGQKFLWGRAIPFLYSESPFERTMYLDADTEFVASPELAFRWLDDWDFALVETPERTLESEMVEEPEMEYSRQMLGARGLLYHNGGMLLWRRNERVRLFFEIWHEEWIEFGSWDPQVALLRALARSRMAFLTLPYTWNCKDPDEAFLVYHRYGGQAAQTHVRPPQEGA